MFKEGKLFGKINIIDLSVVMAVLIAVTGLFLVSSGQHTTSANIIQSKSEVEFDVILKAVKLSSAENLFLDNKKTFITIRNVPYTSLDIVGSKMTHWKTVVPNPTNPSKTIAINDPSAPYTYNFIVTLKDNATITNDGAVIGGNKIKIGLPVMLEGFKYRLKGIVSDIRVKNK